MNLVKVQELAKELSIPELQKYANGASPEIMPAYIALGALQAKEAMQRKMAAMQGAAQGDQPSVKEQVEQKAGLMALQAQQKQQAEQAAPPPGGPVPAGAPQPEPQPEPPEEEVMMAASGGLARLPVDFSFRQGGIIGYAGEEGSSVGDPLDEARARAEAATAKLQRYGLRQRQQDPEGYQAAVEEGRQAMEAIRNLERQISGGPAGVMRRPMGAGPVDRPASQPAPERPQLSPEDMAMRRAPAQGLPSAMPSTPRPAPRPVEQMQQPAQRPAPQVPQAAQAPQTQAAIDQAQLIREEAERRKAFGIEKEIGAGAEARMAEQRKRFEASKPSGIDDLIRLAGQASQYKGLSGLAPAYTANEDQKRAAQAAFEAKMDEQQTAIESARRAEAVGRATGIGSGLATAREQQRLAQEAKERNLTQMEVAKLNYASANRPGERERIYAEYTRLKKTSPAAAEKYLDDIYRGSSGGAADKTDLAALKMLQKSYQDQVSPLGGADAATRKNAQLQLDAINKKIAEIGGVAGGTSSSPLPKGVTVTKIGG